MHLCTLVEWNDRVLELNIVHILVSQVLIVVLRYLLDLLLLNILSHHLLVLGTDFTVPILCRLVFLLASFDERILVSKIDISTWKVWVIIWFAGWYGVTYVAVNWLRIHFSSIFLILINLHVSSGITIFVHLVILIHLLL